MAGNTKADSQDFQSSDCSFEWDEKSQLYFHASTGFYYEPSAGWYYSSRDGLYYKFENGNYVLLESDKVDVSGMHECEQTAPDNDVKDESFTDSCSLDHEKGLAECMNSQENQNPPPPSEWLEETLINLYLSGYSDPATVTDDDVAFPIEMDNGDNFQLSADEYTYELEEGEWIPEDCPSGNVSDEGISWDEENWRAQYGQVNQPGEESVATFPVVDLWDWTMVIETKKAKKSQVARLVGRLVRQSMKLHPSLPCSRSLYKTAPICEVYLDLHSNHQYRDRAAERRALHGGFGVGPGQKNLVLREDSAPSSPVSACANETNDEALNMSFGAGSYARRILENMGWKEGGALGSTMKGLLEPLQAVGNKGNAGLGWTHGGRNLH